MLFKKSNDDNAKLFDGCVTQMKDDCNILEVENLHTVFDSDGATVRAVDGISFNVPAGKTVAIVGESGCGKSVTSLSVMRLLPEPAGHIASGSIRLNMATDFSVPAVDLAVASDAVMQRIRGRKLGMIFQEPMTSLNPVFTVGAQIDEALVLHNTTLSARALRDRSVELLSTVGIPRPSDIYYAYPHELSGGMRQRIMIAMALSCNPSLIIADEPTTALDVTVQAQILDLMQRLKNERDGSIMLITHDLGVVAEIADTVIVMYAGRIVEQGPVRDVLQNPLHPYTAGLLKARPIFHGTAERLYTIPGTVPDPVNLPNHCYFKNRCSAVSPICDDQYPAFRFVDDSHGVACWHCEHAEETHE